MSNFRHSKIDNIIFIGNTGSESIYRYDWWITQEPLYTLISPYIYREYVQGEYHRVFTSDSQFEAPEGYPWGDGDTYISKKNDYDLAYAEFLDTPLTLAEAKTKKFNELKALMDEKMYGNVVFDKGDGDNTYMSDPVSFAYKYNAMQYYDHAGGFPLDFSVLDANNQSIILTQINLTDLTYLIMELYEMCREPYVTHYAAISALTLISDVQSYDITTGWPTVPYNP